MKALAFAAALALVPPTQVTLHSDLSDLERASGWVSMSDESNLAAWGKPSEGWILDGRGLRREATAKSSLAWSEALAEFEIDFEWRESPTAESPWLSGRLVMHRDNSALALLGETRIVHAADSDLPSFRAGPFELTPAQTKPGWHISLMPGNTVIELRSLHLRDRSKEVGKQVEIFDGKSLNGWRALGDAKYTVENGELIGEVGGGSQSFLRTEKEFGDFIFEVELKNDQPGNSGIQVRSHENEQKRLFGYQIEIDPSARAWSGGLYDEARRGWLDDLSDNPRGRAAFKNGEWNRYRIECIGPWIRAWVNDVPTADYLDAKDFEGAFGLQVHSGKDTKMRWRNFRLRELGRSRWVPFDPKALDRFLPGADGRLTNDETRMTGVSLDQNGGLDLILRYSHDDFESSPDSPLESIRMLGPKWELTVPLRELALKGNEVILLCHPPRMAIEVDGKRIAIPGVEFNDFRHARRPIEAWVEFGRTQTLGLAMTLERK